MDRGRYDFVAIAPGQFLGEHHVPLVSGKSSVLSMNSMLVITGRTNLLWLYNAFLVHLRLRGESLKVAKSRPEPKIDTPNMLPAEERLTTRDLFSGVEALKSAGRSSLVK